MRPLPLAALLLAAAPWARAQTRGAAVEAGGVTAVPTVTGDLSAGSAPQLIHLNLASPSLTATPGLVVPGLNPVALTPAAPAPFAPAAISPEAVLPAKLPASAITAVAPVKAAPATKPETPQAGGAARTKEVLDGLPDDLSKVGDAELAEIGRRLFGESSGRPAEMLRQESSGEKAESFKSDYLRHDEPFGFGKEEARRYREALAWGSKSDEREKALLDAAADLLTSAGVGFARAAHKADDGRVLSALVITPDKDGSSLNKLAWNLMRRHGTTVEYSPRQLGTGANAGFITQMKTLFLPHFGSERTFSSVLHESQHSHHAARRAKGDLSPFHAYALARAGQTIVPRAAHYSGQMSMEELTTHAKDFKLFAVSARRQKPTATQEYYALLKAYELADLTRSASLLADRMLSALDQGAEVLPVTDEKTLSILGPVQGGRWMSIWTPWSVLYVPVLDEAPAPPKKGLAKLFSRKPETPGRKAARRTALGLKAWTAEVRPALGGIIAQLEGATDWTAVNALADTVARAARKAEQAFKAAP